MERLLVITGTMGAGKSTILAEASDLLALRKIPHAAIDLDALGLGYISSTTSNDGVMYRNLQSVRENYAAQGVKWMLVARAMEDDAELDLCRSAAGDTNTVVCRLAASVATMAQRVKLRELGTMQQEFVARVAKLNALLDRAHLEDFTITNENRSPAEVAREMLVKAGWIAE